MEWLVYLVLIVGIFTCLIYGVCRFIQMKMIRCAQKYNFYISYRANSKAATYLKQYLLWDKLYQLLFRRRYHPVSRLHRADTIETGYPSRRY